MTDDERFVNVITALCESYRQKASPGLFHGYRLGLAGVGIGDLERAAATALQRCKFMPVPSELRELAVGAGQSFEGMADQAFLTLDKAVRRYSDMASVNFADGLINATVRTLGGWERLHLLTSEQFEIWFRKDFVACYVRLAKSGAGPELTRYLVGATERENAKWDGQVMKHGAVYSLERFAPVENIGSSYKPALPSPLVTERKQIGVAREFLRVGENNRLLASE